MTAYCASKFGVRGFTEALRTEVLAARHPVKVTTVHPGGVKTGIASGNLADASARGVDLTASQRKRVDFYNRRLLRMQPSDAANIILDGVAAGSPRIRVGRDAKVLDYAVRLFPELYPRVVAGLDRRITEARTASKVRAFTVRGRRRSAFLVSGTEVLYLPSAFPALDNVTVYNGWFPALSRLISIQTAIAAATVRIPGGRALVDLLSRPMVGPAGGPDTAERARTLTHVVAVASDETGALAEVHLEGPSIYTLTGELIAWGAAQLLTGPRLTTGVVGPIEAFGREALLQGCAEIGLIAI
ncbi:SDR family NAD(P)-dependent oxidoreductase [Nocardia sp. NPDC059154]|uniref:SDR family NAD(P)-dependent oxidoreductase n=1 Tax=Nocardia sp. NPDC059154 TaxID=3346744 RepID=UPI0036AF4899